MFVSDSETAMFCFENRLSIIFFVTKFYLSSEKFCGFKKNWGIELTSKFLLYSIMVYIVKLLLCSIQHVLLVDSIYIDVLVC